MAIQSMTLDGEQVVGIVKMGDKFKKNFQRRDGVGGDGPVDQDFEDDGSHLREVEFEGSEVTARGDATLVIGGGGGGGGGAIRMMMIEQGRKKRYPADSTGYFDCFKKI